MFLSVLLLLLISSSQATHFYGTMMTYYPKETRADGSVTVILRYKLSFRSCTDSDSWVCGGNCGTMSQTLSLTKVDEISEWCQREGILTYLVPNNSPLQLVLAGGNWIDNILNNIVSWRAVTDVELKNRSDSGRPNTSPQSTVLPAVRVPSNCQRNINLLAFDPDGDEVKCRYGITSNSECNPCTPPSVLSLSSSCTLSFSPTNSNNEGPYAVQLVMEDFPRQNITLTQTNGSQGVKTTTDPISKIPIQFVLKVDPAVPSCIEGQYLPKFLPPTPDNRAHLYTPINQMLEIPIRAATNQSEITELLFSGPYNVVQTASGSGNFTLRWTPSASEDGESHPICFVVQANLSSAVYHSELRCVIVTVGNSPLTTTTYLPVTTRTTVAPGTVSMETITTSTTATTSQTTIINTPTTSVITASSSNTTTNISTPFPGPINIIILDLKISTSLSLEKDSDIIIREIKNELIKRGLPSTITLRILSNGSIQVTTAAP